MPGMRQSAFPRHLHSSCLGWQNRPPPRMPVLWDSRDHVGMCALWLVSVELPDMSGFELCELLCGCRRRVTVYLIGDRYSAEDELRSRTCGFAFYACKPPNTTWLAQWNRSLEHLPEQSSSPRDRHC